MVAAAASEDITPVTGTVLHATEDAWIRVSTQSNLVLYEGILTAGQSFQLPDRADEPVVTSGNAGGTYVSLDGTLFGPLGQRGRVAKKVSLNAADVRTSMPEADLTAIRPEATSPDQQRAAAEVARP